MGEKPKPMFVLGEPSEEWRKNFVAHNKRIERIRKMKKNVKRWAEQWLGVIFFVAAIYWVVWITWLR